MRIDKLTIEAAGTTFCLPLHPRLTVIAGVGTLERRGLVGELLGALGSGREGVHLDLCSDSDQRYRVERQTGTDPRVVDLPTEADITASFRSPGGQVNLFDRAGLTDPAAKRAMRMGEADLTTRSQLEERIGHLSRVDQGRLWDVARKVKDRQHALAELGETVGSDPGETEIFDEIEARHAGLEQAQANLEAVRRVSMLVGANAAVAGLLLAMLAGPVAATVALLVAIVMTGYSFFYWRRMERAQRDEDEAVRAAGAQSYLAFQINRVNGLVADDHLRKQMMQAAEYHRAALAEWRLLAGDATVDWAIAHRREVRQAASRRRDSVAVRNPMSGHLSPDEETTADIAQALVRRLAHLRTLGAGGESFPLLLDEPFPRVRSHVKADLLERLMKAAEGQQIVFLTEDPEVAAWARLEAMTDAVAIVEPADATSGPPDPARSRRRASRHVAA